ncbi:MAG TPA: UDP-N-acetylglucosamine 1-carboxyvinyltransferase [Polyangia bacterium]|nr:UDP-N-acetylglucosamine 1-carboxyvinyltransferase [Polyangia bacterium]
MDKIVINGGRRLKGDVRVSGAKNAALPILASAILAKGTSVFRNVPKLMDVRTMAKLLRILGARVDDADKSGYALAVATDGITKVEAPYELVKTMRASVLVLGPLVARHGEAIVSLPGGCAIGARPIDQHLKGLEAMGAKISLAHGSVTARVPARGGRLRGAAIVCDIPTVTGTENLMMAATLAKGRTTIENAAREPEVEELARVLNKMGARVQGAGTSVISVEGVDELQPIEHAIVADRIEAGTFMVAAALTRGDVLLRDCLPEHLDAVIAKLRSAGAEIVAEDGGLRVRGRHEIEAVDITTQPYPGFPTDMQAQFMTLATRARGQSVITETIFENRYMHVSELARMGADIHVDGRTAVIRGVKKLTGAKVMASDLRASAALILAGLVADGTTEVLRVYHLDRGYEHIEKKLQKLGADVKRAKDG